MTSPATGPGIPAEEVSAGGAQYVAVKGGNNSPTSYQEASGAPIETDSPLGYSVGPVTIVFLTVGTMIGTGVYSTPSAILRGSGSVGLSLVFWGLGFFTSASMLAVYLEFAAYFPNRSGSEVVYLEQAYPKPRWLFPTAFAFLSAVLSFSSSNAIVLAEYLYRLSNKTPTAWELKGVAVTGYTVAVLFVIFHTRYSYWLSNAIGFVKLGTLVFIALTGLVVISRKVPRVQDPHANFRNAFEGNTTPWGVTNALYKVIFAYAGYQNIFNVVNEVKNPVSQLKRYGYFSLAIIAALYILANIAYLAAVPKVELEASTQIAASLFFVKVFGTTGAVRGLNFLIALSTFGNLIAILLGTSRQLRECGRQGVLPFPRFWASTRPFGTPLGPYLAKYVFTLIMILAPPAGDAFNFVVDLQVYPSAFFAFTMTIGLLLVRRRRARLGLPRPAFRTWAPAIGLTIFVKLYLLVMPWWPPAGGSSAGDVSFWYATYAIAGVGILLACSIYYGLWVHMIPRLRGYRIRREILEMSGGARGQRLVKVPLMELEAWDEIHDASGIVVGLAEDAKKEPGEVEGNRGLGIP